MGHFLCSVERIKRFSEQLALALKTEVPLQFFTVLNIFFTIQDFWATRACPEKQSCPEILHCIEYTFYILEFGATCACPEKQRVSWIDSTKYIFFIIQGFLATCACPGKQSCPGIFHCIEINFINQDFCATSACPKNFPCMEYTFYIQNFWATCASPGIFHCIEYVFFSNQNLWETCACPEKQSCTGIFHCIEIFFYYPGFLSNQRLPWNFSNPGVRPSPPPRTPMHIPLQSVFAWQSSSPLTLDRIATNAKGRGIWNIFQTECSFISTSLRYKTRFSTADRWVAEQVVLQLLC